MQTAERRKIWKAEAKVKFKEETENLHSLADSMSDEFVSTPTDFAPGTLEKQAVLAARYKRGVPLFLEA